MASGGFFGWLRHNAEHYLLVDSQKQMAERHGTVAPRSPKGAKDVFWMKIFAPIYAVLPWSLRSTIMKSMPGSHRKTWASPATPQGASSALDQFEFVTPAVSVSKPNGTPPEKKESTVAQIVGTRAQAGDAIVDYDQKLFDDIQAEAGEKAYIFMHTVPYEGSVGLVNMLTCTRINRKGFDTSLVLYGPGVLMGSATRGFPTVGSEAFPGHLAYNNQLQTFMKEGGKVLACRFAMAALYGMRETDLIEGITPIHPLDILDCTLTARREGALVMQTWTL